LLLQNDEIGSGFSAAVGGAYSAKITPAANVP
jgi:hypothetical protein